jgi:DNA mismatch endonuclease (patch repair protein)
MAQVKGVDTAPEILLRRALYRLGLRGWRCHRRTLPGRPDLAFGKARVAVFVDGGFWHGHPDKYWPGRCGPYWDKKIQGNVARDRLVDDRLRALDWMVIRVWDSEVNADVDRVARGIRNAVEQRVGGKHCAQQSHASAPPIGDVARN